jgi:hypothetical protein
MLFLLRPLLEKETALIISIAFTVFRFLPRSSTQRLLAAEKEIPIASITYVQVGDEKLDEVHRDLEEPTKTLNASLSSLFISAGDEMSMRIRLPNELAAASLAAELRDLMQKSKGKIR